MNSLELTNFLLIWIQLIIYCLVIQKVSSNFNFEIDCKSVKRVFSTKCIDVQIDSEFNWNEHIQIICNKMSKGIGILYKASFVLDSSSLLLLY